MECNKDEAQRAKEIAEKKFAANDLAGAMKFAQKAKRLYPGLDGIAKMLATFDVYARASKEIEGETDWYGILDVIPFADTAALQSKYKKLALKLHPDKNTSVGAEGAFQLISDAWSFLSDSSNKTKYDQRRRTPTTASVKQTVNQASTAPAGASVVVDCTKRSKPSGVNNNTSRDRTRTSGLGWGTRWTVCSNCGWQYQISPSDFVCPNKSCGQLVAKETPAQASNSPNEKAKRGHEEALAPDGFLSFANKRRDVGEAGWSGVNNTKKLNDVRALSMDHIKDILREKAREMIRKKISEEKSINMSKHYKGMKHAKVFNQKKSKTSESVEISVADSEFYDFDKNRTEKSFKENQVWAAYDDGDDQMPRFYGLIESVVSQAPFKVRVGWFNPKSNTELGPMDWIGSGFSKTCGHFKASKSVLYGALNSFSHVVEYTKSSRGVIRIFPRKGDVWALYRNWSSDWNKDTPSDVIHKYSMVEVLEDYDKEVGDVVVMPLVKVAGFKTVFRQPLDRDLAWKIPRVDMFRLSHQVPRHVITAEEASGTTLEGCIELDPAATPADIVDAIADVQEDVEEAANHGETQAEHEMKAGESEDVSRNCGD